MNIRLGVAVLDPSFQDLRQTGTVKGHLRNAPAIMPVIGFRAHNRWALAHGLFIGALSLSLTGISRRNRAALCALAAMPIMLAALGDARTS